MSGVKVGVNDVANFAAVRWRKCDAEVEVVVVLLTLAGGGCDDSLVLERGNDSVEVRYKLTWKVDQISCSRSSICFTN